MPDLLELSQALFMCPIDPAEITADEVMPVYDAVMSEHSGNPDVLLRAVAHRFYLFPRHSSERMGTCLIAAFGYLDRDPLAEALLDAVFGG